jgi:hypothetical protein
MDLDLDLFKSNRGRRGRGRGRSREEGSRRRRHPHLFAWVLLAGGALLLCLAAMALASSLGAWGALSDAYFSLTTAILPSSWHDEWRALPGLAHVGIVLVSLFVITGLLGEVFD